MRAIVQKGPVLVAMSVNPALRFFRSGVFTPNDTDNQCPTSNAYLWVELDGYDQDADVPYYTM